MIFDINQALIWTENLLAIALLVQSTELLRISSYPSFQSIWSLENLKADFYPIFIFPKPLIHFLFSISGFRLILMGIFTLAVGSFFYSPFMVYFFIGILHILVNMRFRGNFNGGSDTMTFVIISGLCIANFSDSENVKKIGLIYIGIHGLYSYFKAGLAKVRHADWRTGKAISQFLHYGVLNPKSRFIKTIENNAPLHFFLSWATLCFELGIIILLFAPRFTLFYALLAAAFHLAVFFMFGLNRFFWIWLAAWPGIATLVTTWTRSYNL
jgi:hypothetical protein